MRTLYNSLKEIIPTTKEWRVKVIVAEKMMPRTSIQSTNQYQRLILADAEGNRVQATIFGHDIQLFESTLNISSTYFVINALVRPIKPEHRIVENEYQWTINSKTVIEEVAEDKIQLPALGLNFVPFTEFHKYVDSQSQIDVIAVAIDMEPAREIRTKNGPAKLQELLLIDQNLKPVSLTMWDHFVNGQSAIISNIIKSRPIIIGARLKVVSYKGMSLSTKPSSSFIMNPNNLEAAALRDWAVANEEKLEEIVTDKFYRKSSSSSMTQVTKTVTEIATVSELAKTQHSFWVKAKVVIDNLRQTFWYMACNKCAKGTGMEYNDTFFCLNCKESNAVAQPRCRVDVQLYDETGSLVASLFGDNAEKFMACSATKLMLETTQDGIINIENIAMLSSDQQFMIRLRSSMVDTHGGSRNRFNITALEELPSEDE